MEINSPEKETEYKPSFDEKGNLILKKKSNIKQGKKSKAKGGTFELLVRKNLEEKNWIVDKWTNNLDLDTQRIIPAKRKFNPFNKVMTIGTGFPDFIAFQNSNDKYDLIGVEVKVNGTLSKEEKEKCKVYLEKKVFREILIAKKKKEKNKIYVEYINFEEIKKRMR